MKPSRIVEPYRGTDQQLHLVLPPETPAYLAQAIYQVNLSGEEMLLQLPNGQQAMLSPGTDLGVLGRLVDSEEFQDALDEAFKGNATD